MSKLSKISSDMLKFFTFDKIIIAVILLLVVYVLFSYSSSKNFSLDGMDAGMSQMKQPSVKNTSAQYLVSPPPASGASPSTAPAGYSAQPVAQPSDLLPQDQNKEWSALNPVSMNQGGMVDLLQAGYHIGLDTIGQTLRNANLQLRSDPIIPKSDVGPWNQSTIEADLGRVPLEIGVGCP
uniref:Minor capsid protein P11 C-terminal conserved region domain-containing protein n=1 Tax=viral metagenome TaxID=1070528 RepID=A0A6C0D5Q7_9ZZZZ